MDLFFSVLGSGGSAEIQLRGGSRKWGGYDLESALEGKIVVTPVGQGFHHAGVSVKIVQELYIGGELSAVTKEKVIVIEENGTIDTTREFFFSVPFVGHTDEKERTDPEAAMSQGSVSSGGDVDGIPDALTSVVASGEGGNSSSSVARKDPPSSTEELSHNKNVKEKKSSKTRRKKRRSPLDAPAKPLEHGWLPSYTTTAFIIKHRVVATINRPWYAYGNITVSSDVRLYRRHVPTLKQTQQTVSVAIPECPRVCLLELSSRYIHVDDDIQGTLIMKDLKQPCACAYLLLIKAEYINRESIEEIIRVHHIFGAPSPDILQHIPGTTHFSSGYLERSDEGAVVAPKSRCLVVRGTKIAFSAPVRTELSIYDAHAGGMGLMGLDSETDPSDPSRSIIGSVASKPNSIEGTEAELSRDSESVSVGSSVTSAFTEENLLHVTPSIDTSPFGLAYSRAPGQIERLDDSGVRDDWVATSTHLAGLSGSSSGSISERMRSVSIGSGNGVVGGGPVGGAGGSANELAILLRRRSSDSAVDDGGTVPYSSSNMSLILPPTLTRDTSDLVTPHSLSHSSQGKSFDASSDDHHEAFQQTVFGNSVSVRYYLRLIVQDVNRSILWNSTEVIIYS